MTLANDLAAIRAMQLEFLPDTCHVDRQSLISDGMGGKVSSWTRVATKVKCRVSPIGSYSQERLLADRMAKQSTHVVTLPHGTTADLDCRIHNVTHDVYYTVVANGSEGSLQTAVRLFVTRTT